MLHSRYIFNCGVLPVGIDSISLGVTGMPWVSLLVGLPGLLDATGTDPLHRHHRIRWSASELVEFMERHPQSICMLVEVAVMRSSRIQDQCQSK